MDLLHTLQLYWWAVVSLLGAILVFLLFVQGGQSLFYSISTTEIQKRLLISSLGHKWEITFTTLVTFGGAAFASFPLFYSTSFGGAYWLWLAILFLFVLQAVSYEYRNKASNLFGAKVYDMFLFLNGALGTVLLGVAVATLFSGGAYYMDKMNITSFSSPTVSYWANDWRGLEEIVNPFNLLLGFIVLFSSRTLGLLYIMNVFDKDNNAGVGEKVYNDEYLPMIERSKKQLLVSGPAFVLLFVVFLIVLFLKQGYEVNPSDGLISPVANKYFFNMIELVWPLILLLIGVVLVLGGLVSALFINKKNFFTKNAFFVTGGGVVLAVWAILICAAFNNTVYFPSTVSIQDSLTLYNSSSSLFTLKVMFFASLAVPFVIWYIAYTWRKMKSVDGRY